MERRSAVLLLAGLVGAALLVSGCTQAPTPSPATPPPATPTPTPAVVAREPKRLEAKTTIEMGDMFFADSNGVKGGAFKVPAGKTVGIHIVNKGAIEHELMFGREVEIHEGAPHGYKTNLFKNVPADVFVYPSGKKVEVGTEGGVEEIELEPGADAWIRVKFPDSAKGEWEIGCFVPGHYEAGMKAKFVVE